MTKAMEFIGAVCAVVFPILMIVVARIEMKKRNKEIEKRWGVNEKAK